ncbi:unnamed protein product [Microthlaspi erraticum]|uniref:Uncharacterized protein n=1 Tax=Microthlaspi erraticum TaxID=1685480 RepID=A0A6D2JBF2_9BRAS|nr:unnamed protein product [Microthlaspi erraticum]
MFLRPTPHPQRSKGLMCHHVGTWSPQSPWRREHHSALGTWGAHPPLALSASSMAHLGSLLLIFSTNWFTSSPCWRAIPLLNKVHSNLKLPLLTLTTNGSFLFLVLLSSLNLSLQTAPSERHIPCIRFFHLWFLSSLVYPLHLDILSLILLAFLLLLPVQLLASLTSQHLELVPEMHQNQRIRVVMIGLVNSTLSSIESKNSSDKLDRAG